MMAQVRAPRNVFVDFPLGHQCGKPHDADLQNSILKDALQALVNIKTPGEVVDLPYEWGEPFTYDDYLKDQKDMCEERGIQIQEWLPKSK
jgi:D-proline reductase (dithiol) PrdB